MRVALNQRSRIDPNFRIIPVLLPGVGEAERTRLPAFLTRFAWVEFRESLDDPDAFGRLVADIKGEVPGPAEVTIDYGNPYRGLQSFAESDAQFFYGRATLVARLVESLRQNRFVAVIGPSGSGKSSLVWAGLIPVLRRGDWFVVSLRPGPNPLESLAEALVGLTGRGLPSLLNDMQPDQNSLHQFSQRVLADAPADRRVVFIVDQFEEIFTLCGDEVKRRAFIDNILYTLTVPDGQTTVILIVRADFYGHCLAYSVLARQLEHSHQVLVGPMMADELRQTIEQPARQVGLAFEPGLVDRIITDVAGAPGALPLLQYALLELWMRRQKGLLTHAAYDGIGGVQRALANRAEVVFEQLTPVRQAMVRQALLRLIQVGEGTEDTRRRVRLVELLPIGSEVAELEATVQALADARLLITNNDDQGDTTVELAHEALVRNWPRFRQWIDEDREWLNLHRRLTEAAQEWDRGGRDESFLYRGTRLAELEEWRAVRDADLNPLEYAFLESSVAMQKAGQRAAQRRVRFVVVALTISTIVFFVLALFASVSQRRAEAALRELSTANLAAATAYSPDRTRLVTLNADGTAKLLNAADGTLLATLGNKITFTDFNPDGRLVVTAAEDGQVQLYDAQTGEALISLTGHKARVRKAGFSPNGLRLATAGDDGTARIWDVATGLLVLSLEGHNGPVIDVGFSHDGTKIISTGLDGTTNLWDAQTGQLISTW